MTRPNVPDNQVELRGLPIVLSAPSAGGKSTIAQRIAKKNPSVVLSISCTTRPARPGEKNGVDYFFFSVEEFNRKKEQGEFLESAVVHGHSYGTPRSYVEEKLREGKDVMLTIDPQGAVAVKKIYPFGVFIFVVPPTWDALVERLNARALDNAATVQLRLQNARQELTYLSHYDYVVVNDNLDVAVEDIEAILRAEHRRVSRVDRKDIPIFGEKAQMPT